MKRSGIFPMTAIAAMPPIAAMLLVASCGGDSVPLSDVNPSDVNSPASTDTGGALMDAPDTAADSGVTRDKDLGAMLLDTADDTSGAPQGDASPCTDRYSKSCNADNAVIWLDSCGRPGWVVELCGADRICAMGACQAVCEPHAETACMGGNVFWLDSCGQATDVAKACAANTTCVDSACVPLDFAGTWLVTAKPPTKTVPGFGTSTYPTGLITITLADGVAHTELGGAPFAGTLEGDTLTLTGSWHEEGAPPIEHDATLTLQMTTPGQFFGFQKETLTVEANPAGQLSWDVSGALQ